MKLNLRCRFGKIFNYKENKEVLILCIIFFVTVPFLLTPWVYTDGAADYSWVRSIIIDRDLDCSNEFEYYGEKFQSEYGWNGITDDLYPVKTKTGLQANKYPIGTALLWSPFFFIGHIITLLFTNLPLDGYSKIYVLFVSFASCLYAFLGILMGYYIAKKFFPPKVVLFATLGIWFASSIPVYMYLNPSMPHNTSMFAISLFLFYWIKTLNTRNFKQWVILGVLSGLMTMVRLENLIITICPLLESFYKYYNNLKTKDYKCTRDLFFQNILFVIILVITFSPQIMTWRIVFGKFFVQPYDVHVALVETNRDTGTLSNNEIAAISKKSAVSSFLKYLKRPHIFDTLLGSSYGIFIWTPILFLSVLGLFFFLKSDKIIAFITLMAFVLVVYVTSCAQKEGTSFGDRYLIKCTLIYIIGLSALIKLLRNNIKDMVIVSIISVFILWNGLLIVQYSTGLVPRAGPVSWSKTIKNQFTEAPIKLLRMAKPFLLGRDTVYNVKEQKEENK